MKTNCFRTGFFCFFLFSTANLMSQTIWNGPPMTFTKANFADWTLPENQDKISDDIWITRGNSMPIFNIAVENFDRSPLDTRWAFGSIADGIENLKFNYWVNTIYYDPPSMVGEKMVLYLVTDQAYIDITFTSWTSGGKGGGFSYVRSTGNLSETLWTGPEITFTKADSTDWTLEENQDRITDNVWLTRANEEGIFNPAREESYDWNISSLYASSPSDTRWAFGRISDGIENLYFDHWISAIDKFPPGMVDTNMVLFLVTDSIYIDITFTSWTSESEGGGFSYKRSTGDLSETLWTGPEITFIKADSADWTLEANQDRITNNVWLTRADNEGIFNIALEKSFSHTLAVPAKTLWAYGTTNDGIENLDFDYFLNTIHYNPPAMVDSNMVLKLIPYDIYIDIVFTSWTSGEDSYAPSDTRWAFGSLSDGIENLNFDYWSTTINHYPPGMVDSSMVLYLVTDSIYMDITFTSWTSESKGGGFSYIRSTGNLSETLWTGPEITFTKADSTDWTLEANQDRITSNVWLTRANREGIFNIASEQSYAETLGGGGFSYIRSTNPGSYTNELPNQKNTMICYPNPASEKVYIDHIFRGSETLFELYDLQGKMVLRKRLEENKQISVSHLKSGLYLYKINDTKTCYSGKLIIE